MTHVHKQNKLLFYIKGYTMPFLPKKSLEATLASLYKDCNELEKKSVEERVNYYNKFEGKGRKLQVDTQIKDLLHPKTPKAYYFDTYEMARYFPDHFPIDFAFGDVNTILDAPKITKSRPIFGDNKNNILLNLDKARHFVWVEDGRKFEQKKEQLIGRAAVYQAHRMVFYEKYFSHPMCDLGQVNKSGGNPKWIKPKISIDQHLQYKFILSLEGNDVATNLKWIMASQSIAVAPPLTMETWYMEGLLIPDVHYIQIAKDYHNLPEKCQYYLDHPKEAKEIIHNANAFRNQFNNKKLEKLISILVLKKYFDYFS